MARMRTATPDAAEALTSATLQRALAGLVDDAAAGRPADGDFRPWLLGLQRRVFVAAPFVATPLDHSGAAALTEPGRGATAAWQVLHRALLALPDQLREPLVLADGAGYDDSELASMLGCDTTAMRERVRDGRAALLAALAPARPAHSAFGAPGARRLSSDLRLGARGVGDARPAAAVRPGARRSVSRPRPSTGLPADIALDDGQYFARRLGIALYRALLRGCADSGQQRALGRLLAHEAAGLKLEARSANGSARLGRAGRTNWLRLMLTAYAAPVPNQTLRPIMPSCAGGLK